MTGIKCVFVIGTDNLVQIVASAVGGRDGGPTVEHDDILVITIAQVEGRRQADCPRTDNENGGLFRRVRR